MNNTKEQVSEIVDQLDGDATLEDAMYALFVKMKFQKGKDDLANGRFFLPKKLKLNSFDGNSKVVKTVYRSNL